MGYILGMQGIHDDMSGAVSNGRRLLSGVMCLCFGLFCFVGTAGDALADRSIRRSGGVTAPSGAASGCWSFGRAPGEDARWQKGISGGSLPGRAVGGAAGKGAVADGRKKGREETPRAGKKHGEAGGGVMLSWEEDKTAWRADATRRPSRSDELFALHNHHVLRAQAYVGDDNARLGVGPQAIIKSGDADDALAKERNSPDSAVGFGMQFRIGF